jgi:uncharacterized protein (TIGR02265 family)
VEISGPAPLFAISEPRPWHDDPTLCLRERLEGAPADGLVKGWLFQSVVENAKRHGVEVVAAQRWLGFKDYPVREYLELLGQAAVRVQPDQSAQDTLRLLGRGVYGSFSQSLFGKVVLAGLGSGHDGARTGLRWVTHVYKLTSNHAVATFSESSDGVTTIVLSNVWSFPDAYHVGIFEGVAQAFGGDVGVEVESGGLSDAALTFTWRG